MVSLLPWAGYCLAAILALYIAARVVTFAVLKTFNEFRNDYQDRKVK